MNLVVVALLTLTDRPLPFDVQRRSRPLSTPMGGGIDFFPSHPDPFLVPASTLRDKLQQTHASWSVACRHDEPRVCVALLNPSHSRVHPLFGLHSISHIFLGRMEQWLLIQDDQKYQKKTIYLPYGLHYPKWSLSDPEMAHPAHRRHSQV